MDAAQTAVTEQCLPALSREHSDFCVAFWASIGEAAWKQDSNMRQCCLPIFGRVLDIEIGVIKFCS